MQQSRCFKILMNNLVQVLESIDEPEARLAVDVDIDELPTKQLKQHLVKDKNSSSSATTTTNSTKVTFNLTLKNLPQVLSIMVREGLKRDLI